MRRWAGQTVSPRTAPISSPRYHRSSISAEGPRNDAHCLHADFARIRGGAERQVVALAERMAARGHEVVLFVLQHRVEHVWPTNVRVAFLDMRKLYGCRARPGPRSASCSTFVLISCIAIRFPRTWLRGCFIFYAHSRECFPRFITSMKAAGIGGSRTGSQMAWRSTLRQSVAQ